VRSLLAGSDVSYVLSAQDILLPPRAAPRLHVQVLLVFDLSRSQQRGRIPLRLY